MLNHSKTARTDQTTTTWPSLLPALCLFCSPRLDLNSDEGMTEETPVVIVTAADDDPTVLDQANKAVDKKSCKPVRLRTRIRQRASKGKDRLRRSPTTAYGTLDEDFFHELDKQNVALAIGSEEINLLHRKRVVRKLEHLVRRHTLGESDWVDLLDRVDLLEEEESPTGTASTSSTRPPSIPEGDLSEDDGDQQVNSNGNADQMQGVESTDYAFVNLHAQPERPSSPDTERPGLARQLTLDNACQKKAKNPGGRRRRVQAKLLRSPSYVQDSLRRTHSEAIAAEDAVLDNALKEAGVEIEDKTEQAWDVLYECQRGVNGHFSANALLHFDPAPWCTERMR